MHSDLMTMCPFFGSFLKQNAHRLCLPGNDKKYRKHRIVLLLKHIYHLTSFFLPPPFSHSLPCLFLQVSLALQSMNSLSLFDYFNLHGAYVIVMSCHRPPDQSEHPI